MHVVDTLYFISLSKLSVPYCPLERNSVVNNVAQNKNGRAVRRVLNAGYKQAERDTLILKNTFLLLTCPTLLKGTGVRGLSRFLPTRAQNTLFCLDLIGKPRKRMTIGSLSSLSSCSLQVGQASGRMARCELAWFEGAKRAIVASIVASCSTIDPKSISGAKKTF